MQSSFAKYLGIIGLLILTDFYIFPIGFQGIAAMNTKMLMAACGVLYIFFNSKDLFNEFINKQFICLSLWACGFSLVCMIAVIWNGTSDYTYTSYIISMWVWLFAAFLFINVIRNFHGYITVPLLANYLTAVGVLQSISALLLEYNTGFFNFVKSHQFGLTLLFDLEDRMQGLSAALDPAGVRFALILVILGYVAINYAKDNWPLLLTYLSSFIIITVVGNMIARTTTVGAVIAIAYWIGTLILGNGGQRKEAARIFASLGIALIAFLPFIIHYYRTDPHFQENIRFAFEGFFSLVESGKWEVSSNDILKSMIKFPETAKTWIIGDGYIENPTNGRDPYYVGEHYHGYYMNTDIGYLRFIFYCGLTGLLTFAGFFIYAAKCMMERLPKDRMLALLILVLNFIIWMKVSTDIFQFFALFLCMPLQNYNEEETDGGTADVNTETVREPNDYRLKA